MSGDSQHQQWVGITGCGQGSVGLWHRGNFFTYQSVEMFEELAVLCPESPFVRAVCSIAQRCHHPVQKGVNGKIDRQSQIDMTGSLFFTSLLASLGPAWR